MSLEKARRLVALAVGAATPEHEARNAAMAACRLIAEFNLLDGARGGRQEQPRVTLHDIVREWQYQTEGRVSSRSRRTKSTEAQPVQFEGRVWVVDVIVLKSTANYVEIEWWHNRTKSFQNDLVPRDAVVSIKPTNLTLDEHRMSRIAVTLRYAHHAGLRQNSNGVEADAATV